MAEALASRDGRTGGLSGTQETALDALRGGATFASAAQAAGVTRVTVYRWLRGDPHFRAAYNAWQQEVAESARARLVKLADMAVDVVEKALRRGDEKVAVRVLRGIGALHKGQKGSINPEVLDLKIKLRESRELRRAEMGMLNHLMKKMEMPANQRRRVAAGGPETLQLLSEVQQELERRRQADESAEGPADQAETTDIPEGPAGDVTLPPAGSELPVAESRESEEDNSSINQEMQPDPATLPEGLGDVTSDDTSEGMLHPPREIDEMQATATIEVTGWREGIPCYK